MEIWYRSNSVLLSDFFSLPMNSNFFLHDWLWWLSFHWMELCYNLGLHHMLRELVPHVFLPATLDRNFLLRQVLLATVAHWSPAEF